MRECNDYEISISKLLNKVWQNWRMAARKWTEVMTMAEKEYIEREALKNQIVANKLMAREPATKRILSMIDDIPAADVAPVVHSKWEICCDGYYPYCKRCRNEPQGRVMTQFCPNCGAKMDEEVNYDD